MMEIFPKYVSGFLERDESLCRVEEVKNKYMNCNICKNFCNIFKLSHRKSKEHQKKMTAKFRVISKQIKQLGQNVSIHDEEWQKTDSLYCYFCETSFTKHKVSDGLMVESLGHITHLASLEHKEKLKLYLKYHERKDKFESFCKSEMELNEFLKKLPEAKESYLRNMELLNNKDVQSIREMEESRKILIKEAMQNATRCETNQTVQEQQSYSVINVSQNHNRQLKSLKVPPWQINVENKVHNEELNNKPIIGPTMETLIKHVVVKKKKGLNIKRLGANVKHGKDFSSKWMPTFRGVWNKGKRKIPKSSIK